MTDEYYENGHDSESEYELTQADYDNDELSYQQIELVLTEQKYEIWAISQAVQAIVKSLPQESADSEQQKQLLIIQQMLVKIDSSLKESKKISQDTNNSVKAIEQKNAESQKYYKNIKNQLDQQKKILDEHFSLKFMAFQYLLIALLSSFTTVLALKTFPSTSELSSPTNTELPKASPNRSGNKPKGNKP
jgi:hypothetical protein